MAEELEKNPVVPISLWKRTIFFYVMFFIGSSIILTVSMFFVVTYKLEKRALAALETLDDPADFIHRLRRTQDHHAKDSPPAVDNPVVAVPGREAEPRKEAVSIEKTATLEGVILEESDNIDTLLATIPERTHVEKDSTETDRGERVKRVARIISAMEPEAAGKVVSALDDNLAAEILLSMQARSSGEVLSNVSPEKTGRISKAMLEMDVKIE